MRGRETILAEQQRRAVLFGVCRCCCLALACCTRSLTELLRLARGLRAGASLATEGTMTHLVLHDIAPLTQPPGEQRSNALHL